MINLADKYRPASFDECLLDTNIKDYFNNLIDNPDSIPQVLLFYGQSGCGKTSCARLLGNSISGYIAEIDAASNNGVDSMKAIRELAEYTMPGYKYRVIILDECQRLSSSAWEVLLKTLESPKNTIFILCTTEITKVPETIQSRSTLVRFDKPDTKAVLELLSSIAQVENINLSKINLLEIINQSNGNIRMCINALNGPIIESNMAPILKFIDDFNRLDIKALRSTINNNKDPKKFVSDLLDYLVNDKEALTPDEIKLIKSLFLLMINADYENFKLCLLTDVYLLVYKLKESRGQ